MTRAERVAELLAGASAEERSRLRLVEWAAEYLGHSTPTVYRLTAEGKLPHVKLDGKERRGGRGRAGSIRFRLVDLAAWTVAHEVAALTPPAPPRGARRVALDVKRAEAAS